LREVRTVGVLDLVGLHVRVVDGYVVSRLECDTEQLSRNFEGRLANALKLQVVLDGRLVELVSGLAKLLRIEPPVPGFEAEVTALGIDQRLELGTLHLCPGQGRLPELVQQFVDLLRTLGHVPLEHEVGVGLVSQEFRTLGPQ
jgi:hypothetical protein